LTKLVHAHIPFALAAVALLQAMPSTPAMAQTTNECSAYSIRVCASWQELGYSALKDCRLQEYANCMAGVPPYEPISMIRTQDGVQARTHRTAALPATPKQS